MAEAFKNEDDANITAGIVSGEVEAFKTLYYKYGQALFGFLWQKTHQEDVAEELVQILFTRIWKKRESLDPKQSIRAYLYQAANHLAIDHLRKKVRESEIQEDPHWEHGTTQIDEYGFERRAAISKAVNSLPEAQRKVFLLSRIDGLKYSEIATTLGLSVKTVETHMGRALKKLREQLKAWANLVLVAIVIFW